MYIIKVEKIIMKYLLAAIFLFGLMATPALAVFGVPGSVATNTPLQPIPGGREPNFQHNIDASGNVAPKDQNPGSADQSNKTDSAYQAGPAHLVYSPPGNTAGKIFLGLIFVLLGGLVMYKVFSRNAKK